MTEQPHPLVGKFVIEDTGDGHRTGVVVAAITPEMLLVQFDAMSSGHGPLRMEVVSLDEMASSMQRGEDADALKCWSLFNSAEERELFLSPARPASVVRLVRKDD